MLIRVLIFSTLVLAVNLVAGIFAKDQINQDLSPRNQHDFYTKGETPRISTLLRGSTRYTDSFGTQRDSANLLKKPKITKRFAKEDGRAEGDEENNLTRLTNRRRSLLRDEVRMTESQKSIAGVRRRYQRLKSADKGKESLEAEESAHRVLARTPATLSIAGLSPSPAESTSSDNEDLGHDNKTVKENNNIFERRDIRENETDTKNETGSDNDVSVVKSRIEHTAASAQSLKTNVTAAISEPQIVSTSLRKRRPSTVIRPETQASPLPIAAALTMSESLYNHFHPLDEDVPEDHRLPFLNFGKKLVPVSAKTTSPVASSSSTSSTNSIETVSTSPRTPPVGQYNLLNATPQKLSSANTPAVHIPREEEIHEDMDVSVVKSVVEKNKVSRNRGNSPQSLRKLGGLYLKQETSTHEIAANPSTVGIAPASSTESVALKTEQSTRNNSDFDKSSRKKPGSFHNASTTSSTEFPLISKGTQRKSDSDNRSTTERPNTSVNDNSKVITYLSSHHKHYNETTQNSEISKPLTASPTSHSVIPTQLSASSSRVEATVSTPFARGRPLLTTRNITSFTLPNRKPPPSYQHFYRHSSALSKSSKPPESTSRSNNVSVHNENKTLPEKEFNLTNTSVTTNSNEKSPVPRASSIPLQIKSAFRNSHTGRKEFVDGTTLGVESEVNISELTNNEEKLIANPKERNTKREPLTKSNASLFEDTVSDSGRNITSELSVESVTTKLITSTPAQSSQTNVSIPTEVPSITSSIQSPTTKILSTAVVTSVSVKGAWSVMVTDSPPLEQTLVPPQTYASQNTKNESLEHVLEPPGPHDTNRTQSYVSEPATPKTRHLNISADGSFPRQFPRNVAARNTSSGGNSSSTSIHKEGNDVSKNQKFTTAIKDITSNITEISHIDTENGRNSTTAISVNKTNIGRTTESNETTKVTERGTVSEGSTKETNRSETGTTTGSPDATLRDGRSNGVAYPATSPAGTSRSPTPKPTARNSMNRTDTPTRLPEAMRNATRMSPEHPTRSEDMASQRTHSTPSTVTIASDSEFDFPLLKLYNASTVWPVPANGVTKSPGETSKSATEYPATGNGSATYKAEPEVNIMEATTRKVGVADEVTKATESVNATSDIFEGESRKVAAGKDGEEEKGPGTEADVPNNSTSVSNGGVNPSLGVGNVLSGNNITAGNPRPGESVATTQDVSIAVYVLSALGVVPLAIGIALTARYCVRRRRKLLDDTDAYSDISSRRGARNGGQTGSDVGSPVSGTKLPRVQTHLSWDQEKSTSTIVPVSTTRWEFPRSKLRLQTVLGQGNFGQVLKAEADDISGHEGTTRLVAVKTVKEGASSQEKEDLLRELEIMQQLGSHTNVVTLLGCCTEKEPYLLIMEYVMYGKLLAFLRDRRTRQHYYNFSEDSDALTSRDLTVFAYCVARGMEYLASKGIIHRDLAARNVLVDHNKMCKIADFGMSRSVREMGNMYEQQHTKGALPIRWMAPESLHYRIFTHKSDVWSFGILMWEIVTLGSTPYPTMGAREVMRRVRDGYRLERPSHCRTELFRVISMCWNADPNKRPDFAALRHEIGALIEASKDGGGYVDLESFAESNKYSYSRSEDQSSHHYHHHHHHHHHPVSAPVALGSRVTGDEEILNM